MTTLLAVNWMEIKASEARLNKRIDELRGDMKELRADNRALGEKMDRMLEALLTVKQT